jgi:hypothetical protein
VTAPTAWHAPSLVVMICHVIEGSFLPLLWRWPKILLPIFWWSTAIKINVVDMLRVVVVVWPIFTLSCWS